MSANREVWGECGADVQELIEPAKQTEGIALILFIVINADLAAREAVEEALQLFVVKSGFEEWMPDAEGSGASVAFAGADVFAEGGVGEAHGELMEVLREGSFGGVAQDEDDTGVGDAGVHIRCCRGGPEVSG